MTPPAERLPLSRKLLYGAPTFAGAAVAIPILIHMPKFYSDVVLVPVGYIALAIAFARALDAIIDPAIGWLSDRTTTRLGRRRPFMLIGAPLCAVALFLLFTPLAGLSGAQAGAWFGATFAAYFFFHAVYEIPYLGLGAELTPEYHERSSLFGWRTAFLIAGTMVAAVLPAVFESTLGARGAMSALGGLFGAALVGLFLLLVARVREPAEHAHRSQSALAPGVRIALRNRPFMILMVTFVIASLPSAIPALLVPFYTDYVIDPPDTQKTLSLFLFLYFGSSFLFLPLWVWAAQRFGKLPTWLASFAIGISAGVGLFFAGKGDVLYVALLHVWAGVAFGSGLLLLPAMQADVIDYDELYTGQRREAQFAAFWQMIPKFVAIPGAALHIAVLAQIGYVPNQTQTPEVLLGIRVIYALVPAAFAAAAFFLARLYPISEAVHKQIRAGIAAHARGESAIDPLNGRVVRPPRAAELDPETRGFLDYFSPGELRRTLARGPAGVRNLVLAKTAACAALFVAAAALGMTSLHDIATQPGLVPVLSIVAAGFALTGACFHALRIGAAGRLETGAVPPERIRVYLDPGAAPTPAIAEAAPAAARTGT